MQVVALLGFGAFFVVSLITGIRLLLLWRRSGQLPELLIGMGVLGIGPLGYGFTTLASFTYGSSLALGAAMMAVGVTAPAVGAAAKAVFNWRVYHPESAAARTAAVVLGLALLGILVCDLAAFGVVRIEQSDELHLWSYLSTTARTACLLWGAAEAYRYWRLMRRRRSLGLADPVVTNRFFLWGSSATAAGVGSMVGLLLIHHYGREAIMDEARLLMSGAGFLGAGFMWLAFVPPARYLAWVRARGAEDF
ncbi:MAG: hypothetical protein MJE66_02090 [Proteobacteria bacterium]|nr:hypothetical protein [Pseudomonadota bacterium]